jgi:carbon-monoxide dehydrogenase large subunit
VANPANAQAASQIHDVAPHNTIYQWHIGDPNAVDAAFRSAVHVTKLDIVNNRLVPNAIEPRAAIAEYDVGTDRLTLWNTTQKPGARRNPAAGKPSGGSDPRHCGSDRFSAEW